MLRVDQNVYFYLDEIKIKMMLNLQCTTNSFIFEPVDKVACPGSVFRLVITDFLRACTIFDDFSFNERRNLAIGTKTDETGIIADVLNSGKAGWDGKTLEGLKNPGALAKFYQVVTDTIPVVGGAHEVDVKLYHENGKELEYKKYL